MTETILLIGYMGAGKTAIGRLLAEDRALPFWDFDEWIEQRQKRTITEIFACEGEKYFRDLETEALKEFQKEKKEGVISTGGGLPVRKENRLLIRQLGIPIYLKASANTIIKRLQNDTTRPLLKGQDREKKIEEMLKEREPFYRETAKFYIEVDDKDFEEIIKEIKEKLQLFHKEAVP